MGQESFANIIDSENNYYFWNNIFCPNNIFALIFKIDKMLFHKGRNGT